jgi:hypothetical protein
VKYEVCFATRQGGGGLSTTPTYSLELAREIAVILKKGGARRIEIFEIREVPSHADRFPVPLAGSRNR